MAKKDRILTADATRDGLREIEAADTGGIHASVPEGWQLLHVREG